ncbi:NAD(P)-binding domain-containing protein [Mycoplasmatota bacterium]|nr:NAD(P)-binding domain-containing protein [Mycoplasmatota bacterium]
MKIFIDKKFIPKDEYNNLKSKFPHIEFVHDLNEHKDIEVFFGLNSLLETINIEEYKQLKWIQLYMAGFDNVDVEGLKKRGLLVSNARDIFSITIAEDIISKILYFNRNTKEFLENMKTKSWQQIWKDPEIYNSTIGIIGTGSIGKEAAKRLTAFSPKAILGYRRTNEPVEYFDEIYTGEEGLNHLIQSVDYLILAMPLNNETQYMIDKEKLSLMKKKALLINVARGQVIVQEDLVEVLENHKIRGAALDVTDPEPLPKESKLWDLENVFITPHNASSSEYMVKRLFDLTLENLKLYLNNKEVNYLL